MSNAPYYLDVGQLAGLGKPMPTNCPKCSNPGTWIDYGPNVGKGYYCRTCKDEIEHPSNVYGLSAAKARKLIVRTPMSTAGFSKGYPTMDFLACTKPGCALCNNSIVNTSTTIPKPGDIVECIYPDKQGRLHKGSTYTVVANEANGLRVRILSLSGPIMELSFTKCRFKFARPHAIQTTP